MKEKPVSHLSKLSINMNNLNGSVPEGLCDLPLKSCHAGSDNRYWGDPYFAGAGNGYYWMKQMRGNHYECPLPSCFRGHGACNSTYKSVVGPCAPTANTAAANTAAANTAAALKTDDIPEKGALPPKNPNVRIDYLSGV